MTELWLKKIGINFQEGVDLSKTYTSKLNGPFIIKKSKYLSGFFFKSYVESNLWVKKGNFFGMLN